MAKRARSRSAGQSTIEFLMVAPVLLAISGGTIEISHHMRLNQIATVMSQEIANRSYRQCSDITYITLPTAGTETSVTIDSERTQSAIQSCLASIQQEAQTALRQLLPGDDTTIHLSAYRFSNGTLQRMGYAKPTGTTTSSTTRNYQAGQSGEHKNNGQQSPDTPKQAPSPAFQDMFGAPKGNAIIRTIDSLTLVEANSARARERMVVSEVAFYYQPLIRFIPGFILQNNGMYRATTTL